MAQRPRWVNVLFLLSGLAVLLCGLFYSTRTNHLAATVPYAAPAINYNPGLFCPDAFESTIDNSRSEVTHFEVTLNDGCWSGIITVPTWWTKNWDGFRVQASGDQYGLWARYWFTLHNFPNGTLYGPNHTAFFQNDGNSFRIQGHGTIIVYTQKAHCCQ